MVSTVWECRTRMANPERWTSRDFDNFKAEALPLVHAMNLDTVVESFEDASPFGDGQSSNPPSTAPPIWPELIRV